MITNSAEPGDLALFLWLSPAFPVGAFAYSHGLEWAVEAGDIVDAVSLRLWLGRPQRSRRPARRRDVCSPPPIARSRVRTGSASNDANELAIALAGSMERRLETSAQGLAFLARRARRLGLRGARPSARRGRRSRRLRRRCRRRRGRPRLRGWSPRCPPSSSRVFANLVSAAVRLSAIGQTDGQRVLAALLPRLAAMAAECAGRRSRSVWAAALFAPTSPPSGMKPNIRGCSAS